VNENDVIAEESVPVTSGQGTLELSLKIPSDATLTGSFTVQFPAGIRLDQVNTKLINELSAAFEPVFTERENNTWLIEIRHKELRSDTQAETYKKIMDIAYLVDADLATGEYAILLQTIDFILDNGTRITEDSLPVHINVQHDTSGGEPDPEDLEPDPEPEDKPEVPTGAEDMDISPVQAHIQNNRLHVNSPEAEQITVYSFGGAQLFTAPKPSGEASFTVRDIQEKALIVRGSSGWVKKVVVSR
jgi:hypothetical protein